MPHLNRREFVSGAAAGMAMAHWSAKTAGSQDNLTAATLGELAPRGARRILYVSDPSSIAIRYLPDPVAREDLQDWVDQLAASGVDTFIQEAYTQGWTTYWREDDLEYDARPQHRRFLPLLNQGIQPLEVLLKQCHARGLEFLAGVRMNDNHGHISVRQGVGAGARFLVDHPEWQLQAAPPGPYYKLATPLDFSFPQVRNYLFRVSQRLVDRFAVDGLELCFRDHRYFLPGKGVESQPVMTQLVERIRGMLDQAGQRRGKRLILGARVFPTLEECRSLGLDVEAWISAGLIDYVAPNDTMYSEPNAQYEQFARLTRAGECRLYPGLLPWTSLRMRRRLGGQPITADQQRAVVTNMYAAGADGISSYNHFVTMDWPPFYPQMLRSLSELKDPQALGALDRHYVFEPAWAGCLGFGRDRSSTGLVKADRLTLRRVTGSTGQYRLRICERLSRCRGATLLFRAFGAKMEDRLEVRLNGMVVPQRALRVRADEPRVDMKASVDPNSTASAGLPPVPELPGSWITYWFDLSEPPAKFGDNWLEVKLLEPAPGSKQDVVIDEVEVFVKA